ncbi:MAG: ABC transporter ATP-binding protein [Vulcanimicrobiaceae bacterium]
MPALALRGIVKRFGDLVAVGGVDLDLEAGAIVGLIGENGAGKSTLSNIAFGAVAPDQGTVERKGVVGLVHQHFQLVERLSVWENVLLGREPRKGWRLDVAAARARVRELGRRYGLEVDPDAIVETLPIGLKQRVELLRELEREPAILLLDEPTAVLAPSEIASFFNTVVALAKRGIAILVITHKLAEVIAYTSRVNVMRAGTIVASYDTEKTTAEELARAMVGGELPPLAERTTCSGSQPAIVQVRGLRAKAHTDALDGIDLDVHRGEIVGIAGVEGNGQSMLADALCGVISYTGSIRFAGDDFNSKTTPRERLLRGLASIPQDRQYEALVLDWTVTENAILGRERNAELRRGAAIDRAAARRFAQTVVEQFDVRPPQIEARARSLSGGNQQKVVVGRALAGKPSFVVAHQPTRGIDVGAAALVQSRLIEARNAGSAILLISLELDEIFALADRLLVLYRGKAVGEFGRDNFDRARIGALMAGSA